MSATSGSRASADVSHRGPGDGGFSVQKWPAATPDDLATAVLARDRRTSIDFAPAMNPFMWSHAATRRNLAQLAADGIAVVGPNAGEMAEVGEAGRGRMAEPLEIVAAIAKILWPAKAGGTTRGAAACW